MTRPLCSHVQCDRPVVRYRDSSGWCMFHPDREPPVVDPKTGKPVVATPLRTARPPRPRAPHAPRAAKTPRQPRRAPTPRPATKPATPLEVAAAYAVTAPLVAAISLLDPDVEVVDAAADQRLVAVA